MVGDGGRRGDDEEKRKRKKKKTEEKDDDIDDDTGTGVHGEKKKSIILPSMIKNKDKRMAVHAKRKHEKKLEKRKRAKERESSVKKAVELGEEVNYYTSPFSEMSSDSSEYGMLVPIL